MKVILEQGANYVIRFDKGEELMGALLKFAQEQNIRAATFTGIGACDSVELGFFNPFVKDYRKKNFLEELEITSLVGTVSEKDGQPFVHAHGTFTKNDFTAVGGHIFKAPISVTAEVFLTKLDGSMKRVSNAELNIALLD